MIHIFVFNHINLIEVEVFSSIQIHLGAMSSGGLMPLLGSPKAKRS